MRYEGWSYRNLQDLREQLEEAIQSGQQLKRVLQEVNAEVSKRRFALVAILEGQVRREYGRWNTADRCKEQAKAMGLPVGQPFELEGKPFETAIIELFPAE